MVVVGQNEPAAKWLVWTKNTTKRSNGDCLGNGGQSYVPTLFPATAPLCGASQSHALWAWLITRPRSVTTLGGRILLRDPRDVSRRADGRRHSGASDDLDAPRDKSAARPPHDPEWARFSLAAATNPVTSFPPWLFDGPLASRLFCLKWQPQPLRFMAG